MFAQDPRFRALLADEQDALSRDAYAVHREVTECGELVEGVAPRP